MFHFRESELILHVLPFASREVSTYIYPRTPGRRPAQDIKNMVLELNEAWWKERRRTRCRRNASEHVLEKGEKNLAPPEAVKPVVMRGPTALQKHLTELKITADNLSLAEFQVKIETA